MLEVIYLMREFALFSINEWGKFMKYNNQKLAKRLNNYSDIRNKLYVKK